MHALTELIKSDMKPALGVTEPGAIAFAVSTAKAHIKGTVKRVGLRLNSGMYKNAFTCGIPGTSEVGNYYAAALGAVAADPKKGLECLEGIGKAEEEAAGEMIKAGMISVSMSSITSRIFIEATVTGETSEAVVTIQDAHTNITKITENGTVVFEKEAKRITKANDVQVIDKATLPKNPIKPNKVMNVLIAFVLGTMIGLFVVFLIEYLDNKMKTPQDIEKHLGLSVIGVIPNEDIA